MLTDLGASLALIQAAATASPPPAKAPTELLTYIVGAAAVFQALFAGFALLGLRDTRIATQAATEGLRLTRETSQRQLRAYLCYKQGRPAPLASGCVMTCDLEFTNCGVTPAYDVMGFGTCVAVESIEEFNYPPPPPSVRQSASHTTLGANDATSLRAQSDAPLTPAELADIRSGRLFVLVYGAFEYRDTFGMERRTPFRLNLLQDDKAPDGRLWLCSQGNAAT